jgi:hypothetical protein
LFAVAFLLPIAPWYHTPCRTAIVYSTSLYAISYDGFFLPTTQGILYQVLWVLLITYIKCCVVDGAEIDGGSGERCGERAVMMVKNCDDRQCVTDHSIGMDTKIFSTN